jgi:hypothetical protein
MDCNPWADTHLRLRKARLDATLWMPDPYACRQDVY